MWVQFLQRREILNRTEYVDLLDARVRRVEEFLDTTLSWLFPRIYSQEIFSGFPLPWEDNRWNIKFLCNLLVL